MTFYTDPEEVKKLNVFTIMIGERKFDAHDGDYFGYYIGPDLEIYTCEIFYEIKDGKVIAYDEHSDSVIDEEFFNRTFPTYKIAADALISSLKNVLIKSVEGWEDEVKESIEEYFHENEE